ncbi:MAG: toprim domain-containing protein [Alphaproteobacteria bacterium]
MNDFKDINAAALSSGLLESLYPKAKRYGQYLRIGNLAGDEGASLSINLRTGAWTDFATGEYGGDFISLIAARDGISQSQALHKLSEGAYEYIYRAPSFSVSPPPSAKAAKLANVSFALKLWNESQPAGNTPVQAYLKGRGITCTIPPDIHYHPALWHSASGKAYPAMIAAIRDSLSNEITGVHRTWILPDGSGKAPVKPDKMMLGDSKGGSVQLAPAALKMAVAEGIETSLSVMQETGLPVWAALSTSGITGLELPPLPAVSEIIIAGDNDKAGRKAAFEAAELWTKKGRKAFTAFPSLHNDYNDSIQG